MADTLRHIGAQMANVMFNLAQRPGEPITGDIVATMDSLRKQWDAAVRATPSSASTAPNSPEFEGINVVDERAAFEHHERASELRRAGVEHDGTGGWYENPCVESAWEGWQARAALASRPAEVDDEGKADAKRLDWLESANLTFCGNYSNTGFRAIGSSMWHGTLREAIDGAMFEAGASPSCTTSAGAT